MRRQWFFAAVAVMTCRAASAGEADVIAAKAHRARDGSHDFDAAIRGDDKGRNHYAGRSAVPAPDGTATRAALPR